MDAVARLTASLRAVTRRVQLRSCLRGLTVLALTALILTLALAAHLQSAPAPGTLLASRAVLAFVLGSTVAFALWMPLRRSTFTAVIRRLERQWPPFDQRLLTFVTLTSRNRDNAFLPLLAQEILALAPHCPARWLIPRRNLAFYAASLLLLGSALTRIPFWGQALWGFRHPFAVELTAPGGPVARGRDFPVSAKATGFTATAAVLWVKDAVSRRWRQTPMRPDGASVFRAKIDNLPADAEYFVSVDGVRSRRAAIQTLDVPLVRSFETTRRANLPELAVETDRPMQGGQLECACGKTLALPDTVDNRALVALDRSAGGVYHVNVRRAGAPVRISDDFEIAMFDSWIPKGEKETVPAPRVPVPDRVPAGYETAVREYYRLINRNEPGQQPRRR